MSEHATPLVAPNYYHLKKARAAFREGSQDELELLSEVYRGDSIRHHVYHSVCSGHSWISLQELLSLPPGKFCPYCHETEDLFRFGDMGQIQFTVYRESNYGTYFLASNPIGCASQEYVFWCTRHRRNYMATFKDFRNSAGVTNACPDCVKTRK